MKAYNVKVTVRNNLILEAMIENGYSSQSELARAMGCHRSVLYALVSFKSAPINQATGEFTETAKMLMEVLGAAPSDLWTPTQLNLAIRNNTASFVLDEEALTSLMSPSRERDCVEGPEGEVFRRELHEKLPRIFSYRLTPREAAVLSYRASGKTLDEIGEMYDLTRERMRQVEHKAMIKIRTMDLDNGGDLRDCAQ